MVKQGEKPKLDTRWKEHSFAEGKILELLERCFEYDPDKRINMFETVEFLERAVEENARRKREAPRLRKVE